MDDLLGEPAETVHIFDLIAANPAIGLVSPDDHLVSISRFVGFNEENVAKLLAAHGWEPVHAWRTDGLFVAGSMFWFRLAALQGLVERANVATFETEQGQTDGTIAHAYERIFALVAGQAGFDQPDAQ